MEINKLTEYLYFCVNLLSTFKTLFGQLILSKIKEAHLNNQMGLHSRIGIEWYGSD